MEWGGKSEIENPKIMARAEMTARRFNSAVSASMDIQDMAGHGAERARSLGFRDRFLELTATISDLEQG